jgi:hypothetical protein
MSSWVSSLSEILSVELSLLAFHGSSLMVAFAVPDVSNG